LQISSFQWKKSRSEREKYNFDLRLDIVKLKILNYLFGCKIEIQTLSPIKTKILSFWKVLIFENCYFCTNSKVGLLLEFVKFKYSYERDRFESQNLGIKRIGYVV